MSAQVRHTCQALIATVNHDRSQQRNSNWGRRLALTPAPRSPLPLPPSPSPFLPPLFGGNIQQVSPRASPLLPFLFRRRKLRERAGFVCLSVFPHGRDIYPVRGETAWGHVHTPRPFPCGLWDATFLSQFLSHFHSPRIAFLSSLFF